MQEDDQEEKIRLRHCSQELQSVQDAPAWVISTEVLKSDYFGLPETLSAWRYQTLSLSEESSKQLDGWLKAAEREEPIVGQTKILGSGWQRSQEPQANNQADLEFSQASDRLQLAWLLKLADKGHIELPERHLVERWYEKSADAPHDELRAELVNLHAFESALVTDGRSVTNHDTLSHLALAYADVRDEKAYASEIDQQRLSDWVSQKDKDTILLRLITRSMKDGDSLPSLAESQTPVPKFRRLTPNSDIEQLQSLVDKGSSEYTHLSEDHFSTVNHWISCNEKGEKSADQQPITVVSEWVEVSPHDVRPRKTGPLVEYTSKSDTHELRLLDYLNKHGWLSLSKAKSDLLNDWVRAREERPSQGKSEWTRQLESWTNSERAIQRAKKREKQGPEPEM